MKDKMKRIGALVGVILLAGSIIATLVSNALVAAKIRRAKTHKSGQSSASADAKKSPTFRLTGTQGISTAKAL